MSRITFDFGYESPEHGLVDVEAQYIVERPDFYSRESDWDYNGMQDLEYYIVTKDGKDISVDIPEDVLYHNLREYARNAEISGCFAKETGGF